jgi:hypothetical protein
MTRLKIVQILSTYRSLPNEDLRELYSSLIIIRMIKSRRMKLAGHMNGTKEERL